MAYVRALESSNVPVIFESEHLAQLLGRKASFLHKVAAAPEYFYRNFSIPKRHGGVRTLCAPYPSLKECQRWILDEILARKRCSSSSVGFTQGKSILDHAGPHVGSREILILDIRDFFPSIRINRIISIFRGFGYTHDVSQLLGRLCCRDGVLPQGAPTSPALANLVCRRLDARLRKSAKKAGLTFTRYADDLCFSGEKIPPGFESLVHLITKREGFLIKREKSRQFNERDTRRLVTGLNVTMTELRVTRQYKRELRTALYYINKYGLQSHMAKNKMRDPMYVQRLLGKVGFWLHVEPESEEARAFSERLRELAPYLE